MGLYFVLQARPSPFSLIWDFCSSVRVFASDFLQIPPHGGHPCLSLTVPTAKPVADFHHQVITHAGRTMKSTSWYVYRTRRCGSFICVFWMRAYYVLSKYFWYNKFEFCFSAWCKIVSIGTICFCIIAAQRKIINSRILSKKSESIRLFMIPVSTLNGKFL